jgi:peroxin-3
MVLQESGVLSASEPSSPQTAASLRHLLDETSDLIESPSFSRILTLLNNEGFSTLVDQKCAAHAFQALATDQSATAPQAFPSAATIVPSSVPPSPKAKLAVVLAVMTREAHNIGNGSSPPNQYLVAMEQNVRELEAFAAVVYSSNFDLRLLNPNLGLSNVSTTTNTTSSPFQPPVVEEGLHNDVNEGGTTSFIDIGSASVPPLESIDHPNVGPSASLPSGAPVDQTFEKVWGKAVEEPSPNGER